jgi:hypothetical protein
MSKLVPPRPLELTDADYKAAAEELDCEVAAVKAIAKVESRNSGFLYDETSNAWVPIILFERHKMYASLNKLGLLTPDNLKMTDIINKQPGGYLKPSLEHGRLQKAVMVHRESALSSASWGTFQIMGFNWKVCGYKSLQDFITAMYTSPAKHLEAFVQFIKANKLLHKALQNKQWATVAKLYNGPDYAINKYDVKMAQAYNSFLK